MYDLMSAVKALRAELGESQQSFANRLGLSSRAVASYEAGDRKPSVTMLFSMAMIASQRGLDDLAKVFSGEYAQALKGATKPVNDEETAWVRIALALVRNQHLVPTWDKIAKACIEAVEALAATAPTTSTLMADAEELSETATWMRGHFAPAPEVQLDRLARKRMSESGEPFGRAYARVVKENPELYQRFLAELPPDVQPAAMFPEQGS